MTSVMIWLEWIYHMYMACTGMLLVNPLSICCSMNLTKEQHKEIFALWIMCYLRCGQYNMHQNLNHLMRFCHSIADTSIKFHCENYKKQKTFHCTSGYWCCALYLEICFQKAKLSLAVYFLCSVNFNCFPAYCGLHVALRNGSSLLFLHNVWHK